MDSRVQEILADATDIQRRYVTQRLISRDPAKAARALGISRSTPHKWPNFQELEEAVGLLLLDAVEAARLALKDLALDAVQALGQALKDGGGPSVAAARAVFDRIGLPAMSQVDLTTKGQSLQPISFVEVVSPDDGE